MKPDNNVFKNILKKVNAGIAQYWVLLDPDDFKCTDAARISKQAQACGADAILIGGSLINTAHFDEFVNAVKHVVKIPVILFPGDSTQLSRHADAVLFLSLVSGRNPVNLIGEQVKGAPLVKKLGIEPISTAYMLVESGTVTSVEFMSNTRPIPRAKPMIAAAHALAAEYMGMSMIYLEAGSGALQSVPAAMIAKVKEYVTMPVICGGGIRDAETALEKIKAGADIIVTGNILRLPDGTKRMKEISAAVKKARSRKKL